MKKYLIVVVLFVLAQPIIAQNYLEDWKNKSLEPSVRAEALNDYIWDEYIYSNPDSAYVLAQVLRKFSEKNHYPKGVASAYNTKAITFYIMGDYVKALGLHLKSFELRKEQKDSIGMASSLNNIGLIYYAQKNFKEALSYYGKSLALETAMGNEEGVASSQVNIGLVYYLMLELDKAQEKFEYALKVYETLEDKAGMATAYNNLGQVSIERGEYAKALVDLQKSLEIYQTTSSKFGMSMVTVNMGKAYMGLKDYTSALKYCKETYELALGISSLSHQKDGCECIYNAYKGSNNPKKALEFLELFISLEDSFKVGETTKILERMEFSKKWLADSIIQEKDKVQTELDHKLELNKKNNIRNYLIGFGLFVLVVAIGVFKRLRLVRASKKVVEKERKRSDDLLLNILPAEIAEELKNKGEAQARDYENASILFTDFKGFTELSASLSAKDLVSEINLYFKKFDAICLKYKIEKIKTIGDAYMAVGGIPISNPESIKNTVLAALEMAAFVESKYKNHQWPFQMRAGIHTGHVVAGIAGVNKFQYDIWGDSVNLASRMESSGEVGKVNISQNTYDFLKEDPDFVFESRGEIKAKGKGLVHMYFVQKR